ncbi:glycosyltransferase family 4 protein [Candidatus Nitrosocosmicus hydrocola]|uniref:glycosyltransferase family 4 protein n=1 Tax=Candidatus Nitrosocosmicus hydrocola TaxID=1826872 RepID=UPI000A913B09|nr:glycosyltransferase family 4 protein [Candidatus Nitrosocosmicus hydrocola]
MKDKLKFGVLLIDNQGLSHYTSYLAKGLAKSRRILLLGLSVEEYRDTQAINEKNITFYDLSAGLPKNTSLYNILLKKPLSLFRSLIRFTLFKNYDLIHFQGHLPLIFLLIPLIKLRKKKIYWTIHDIDLRPSSIGRRGKLEIIYVRFITQPKILGRFVDKIFVHGRKLSENLCRSGISPNKIQTIPHFDYFYLVKEHDEHVLDIEKNKYILFFGSIKPYKGISVLLEAIIILRQRYKENFEVLIAGKGNFTEQETILLKNMKNIVIRNEKILNSNIPEIFHNAMMVILPYNEASQSGVLSLAYTFSKPVLVSDAGSLHEYVDNGITGFVFHKGNSEELANLILRLLKDEKLCIELGNNGYQKLVSEMSLEKCCNIIEHTYLEN